MTTLVDLLKPRASTPVKKLSFLIINCSLTLDLEKSRTNKLIQTAQKKLEKHAVVDVVHLASMSFEPGTDLNTQAGKEDEMTGLMKSLKKYNGIIVATPIWWGNQSSLCQSLIERLDYFDDEFINGRGDYFKGMSFSVLISGAVDGDQHIAGQLFSFAVQNGFHITPRAVVSTHEQDLKKIETDKDLLHLLDLMIEGLIK